MEHDERRSEGTGGEPVREEDVEPEEVEFLRFSRENSTSALGLGEDLLEEQASFRQHQSEPIFHSFVQDEPQQPGEGYIFPPWTGIHTGAQRMFSTPMDLSETWTMETAPWRLGGKQKSRVDPSMTAQAAAMAATYDGGEEGSNFLFPARVQNQAGAVQQYFAQEVKDDSRVIFVDGDKTENTYYYQSLSEALDQAESGLLTRRPFWIDISDITPEDLKILEFEFGVHPLIVEDIGEREPREKTETFDKYRCVVLHEMYYNTDGGIVISPYILLVFSTFAISIHSSKTNNSLETLKSLREARSGMPQPDWIMYAVLDAIVDSFIPIVGLLVSEASALDQLALTLSMDDQSDFLDRIRIARSKLSRVRTTLLVKREVMNQLTARGYVAFVKELTKIYLKDVADELHQLLSKCDVASAALNSFPSTFLARLSVESSEVSMQVNNLMKKFSAVATIALPLTWVATVWGMNVKVPGQDEDNHIWFGSICGAMGLFALLLSYYFKRIRWF